MRVGIAADHAGYGLKSDLHRLLAGAGHEVVDFGAFGLSPDDDYPDFVVPLGRAVSKGEVERGIAVCGSGVGACVAANKLPGVRASLVHDVFSAHQGVEDDNMNLICLGGRVTGLALAWDFTQAFLRARFAGNERHARRLAKVAALEGPIMPCEGNGPNPLLRLHALGQSTWLDFLRRGMISSGEIRQLIDEDGLCGITSNPSIFEKAIGGSHDYDEAIRVLALSGKSVDEVYRSLTVEDLQRATDLFRPVFDQTGGRDGFVSLEVSPRLAHDTEGTILEARGLWAAVGRPNTMIKVPATPEGLPAIRQLITEGINVNVTLLFSVDRYRQVLDAFLSGLETRSLEGSPLGSLASVASFFLSRIDVLVDSLLDRAAAGNPARAGLARQLRGAVAVASARVAYQVYKEAFSSDRFSRLAAMGARRQRLLWASTSTKDPSYSDVKYVEPLIGANTVNTMPLETITAYRLHGDPAPRLEESAADSQRILSRLAEVGLDLAAITQQLEDEGVRKFADSFDRLMATLKQKIEAALQGPLDRSALSLGSYAASAEESMRGMEHEHFAVRLWHKDPGLWKAPSASQDSIGNALGWLHLPEKMEEHLDAIKGFAAETSAAGLHHVVHLGMGGSSLAAEVFRRSVAPPAGALRAVILDTNDPAAILRVERETHVPDTLFIVASKSGTTAETIAGYKYFYSKISALKGDRAGENFVAITDPDTPLVRLAQEKGFRRVFLNFPDVGGRYSALSYFGLLPSALMGIDVDEILLRALRMMHACLSSAGVEDNPGIALGAAIGSLARQGRDKLTLVIPEEIEAMGLWLEQLIAESTGKDNTGILPVAGEPVGTPDVYDADRFFVRIGLQDEVDDRSKRAFETLRDAGFPTLTTRSGDMLDLGQEFFRWEIAAATAGSMLGINPFDQPNVEESKREANRVLEALRRSGSMPEMKAARVEEPLTFYGPGASESGRNLLKGFLAQARPGDYVAIQAYLSETVETDVVLEAMRLSLRDSLRLAVTTGYGPRFLHSTGQFHKGGPNNGLFIQLTADTSEDVPIPGEPFTFGDFRLAQAIGDFEALQKRGRRIVRVHLGPNVALALDVLAGAIHAALGEIHHRQQHRTDRR